MAEPKPKDGDLEFESMIYETNASDGDAEMVIYAKAPDGMRSFNIMNAKGQKLARLNLNKNTNPLGAQQAPIESSEPGVEEVQDAYPEGTYYFIGHTIGGDRVFGETEFTHSLPGEPQITICDLELNPTNAVVRWVNPYDADGVFVEVENDDEELAIVFELSADTETVALPAEVMASGLEYDVAVRA